MKRRSVVLGLFLLCVSPCWSQSFTAAQESALDHIKQCGGEFRLIKGSKSELAVRLEGTRATDADLVHLKALKGLVHLSLVLCHISNEG